MTKAIQFKILAEDPARAAAFYKTAFGWKIAKRAGPNGAWSVARGAKCAPGPAGAIAKRKGKRLPDLKSVEYLCGIEVADIDASLERATRAGGRVTRGKQPVPGVGIVAYGKDPEGNTFGVIQPEDAFARPDTFLAAATLAGVIRPSADSIRPSAGSRQDKEKE